MILNGLNVKTILVFSVTFAEFLNPSKPLAPQLLTLGGGTYLFCILSQLSWTMAGSIAGKVGRNRQKEISYASALMLVAVAVWIAFDWNKAA